MTIAAWIRLAALILVGLALLRLHPARAPRPADDEGEAQPYVATVPEGEEPARYQSQLRRGGGSSGASARASTGS